MKIKEVMSSSPKVISCDMTLKDAANEMKKEDCGIQLIGKGEKLQDLDGLISDRDIALAIADGKGPETRLKDISDVMNKTVETCKETDEAEMAAQKMKNNKIRRLVVVNDQQKVVGVVSLGDLACKAKNEHMVAETLRAVSSG